MTGTLCRMAVSRIQEITLLILDLSDISKKYARKMEYLARVHDGSEDGLGTGYWLLQIIGAEPGKPMVLPLYIIASTLNGVRTIKAKTSRS